MDIERMHNIIEKLTEAVTAELDKGIDCIDTCEMGAAVDMIKDITESMYYRTLVNSMQESDSGEVLEMFDRYGRNRRGYHEPPYMRRMNTEDLQGWGSMSERERMRDLDRASRGRMYYTETEPMRKDGVMRDEKEGKAGMMRKGYMETKEMHKGTTPQDKEANMNSLESYLKE